MDSIDHTFNSGPFATAVWNFFAATAGLQPGQLTLKARLRQWWTTKTRNAGHQLLLQATPVFICWNLWQNRCASKYGGKVTNISRVKYAIYKDTYKMLENTFPQINWPARWTTLLQTSERCKHTIKVYMVAWKRPPEHWIKLNTDGSAVINTGKIGAGGILKNREGKMVMAYSVFLGEGSNNQAETKAAQLGLSWALELGYKNIQMELDSQLVVQWITKKTAPQWTVANQVEEIQQLISQTQYFSCSHIFREANSVADSLAKHSNNTTTPQVYFNTNQLPKETQAYYQMDLQNMPTFRRKKTKKIFEPP
nr:uncharacterized protein LOC104645185 [Solanum lycopersicum]